MAESMQQEHQRLVDANKQLLEQMEASNKRTQVWHVCTSQHGASAADVLAQCVP